MTEAQMLTRRERKKQATRSAIKRVALTLVLEHGLDHVTVEQISEAADVAPRTFFNYFSCKEDALLGDSEDITAELRERLLSRPAGEAPLRALRAAIAGSDFMRDAAGKRQQMLDRHRLVQRCPALLHRELAQYASVERMVAEVMARRLDDHDGDLRPALLAAMASSVMRVATTRWSADASTPLHELIDYVFDLVERGGVLPEPATGHAVTTHDMQEVTQ